MSRRTMVPLSEVLMLDSIQEVIDPGQTYQMAGVYSYARGLFYRGPQDGGTTSYKIFHRVRAGHIVLSQLKAWEGAIALVDKEAEGLFLPPHNSCFSVLSSKADERFVWWFLKQPSVWDQLRAGSRGMGARRETVSINTFLNVKIVLPSITMQRRIVAQLDAISARLTQRKAVAAALEHELAAMLRAVFHRLIAGASSVRMEDIAPLVRRFVEIDPESNYPELGIRSFGKGTFHKPSLNGIEVGTKRLFKIEKDDLLFNIVFAWEGAVAVAQPKDHGRVGSHRFLTCVPDSSRATPTFLRYFFLTPEGILKLGEASPGGAGRNRTLGLKALEAIKVPVPPLDKQRWFDLLQTKVAAIRSTHAAAEAESLKLLPALLDSAFSGDIPEQQAV